MRLCIHVQNIADDMQNVAGQPRHIDGGIVRMLKQCHKNKRLQGTGENTSARDEIESVPAIRYIEDYRCCIIGRCMESRIAEETGDEDSALDAALFHNRKVLS